MLKVIQNFTFCSLCPTFYIPSLFCSQISHREVFEFWDNVWWGWGDDGRGVIERLYCNKASISFHANGITYYKKIPLAWAGGIFT